MSFGGVHLWFEFSLVAEINSNRWDNGSGSVRHPATAVDAISEATQTSASQQIGNSFVNDNTSRI